MLAILNEPEEEEEEVKKINKSRTQEEIYEERRVNKMK